MAVHAALDDQGFDLWNRWSQGADNYDAQAARTVWKGFKADGGITIATLFDEAKRQGWRDAEDHPKPSAQEIAERERLAVERARRGQAKIASIREKTAENAARIWKAAHPAPVDNPYLVRKGIAPVANLRETTAEAVAKELGYVPESNGEPFAGRLLVVPVDQGGHLSTLELIDGNGRKSAIAGRGTKAGGFWSAELPDTVETLLVAEGMATAVSASLASGCPAVAALASSNLEKVAVRLRQRYPASRLAILADLVKATGEPDCHAFKAAKAVDGVVIAPVFIERSEGDTDFNDLAAREGLQAGKACIARALAAPDAAPFPSAEARPCFVVLDDWRYWERHKLCPGVYSCTLKFDRDDKPTLVDTWFCSPLHVEAITFDGQENNFGRLLSFVNSLGRWRQWAMPMELLRGSGEELRGELLAMGVELDPFKARQLLPAYLQGEHPKRRVHCALQTGWVDSSFVLPDAVIGPQAGNVIFQSGERGHDEHTTAGTLDGWRNGIATRARGNCLMLLALSAGFAGPLLTRCNAEGGGIHFVGDSSTGKTTLIEAACSIWGGANYKRSWRATANGIEGAASLFNDGLLALDEISECDPRELGAIIYALGNGCGKQRANRSGAARHVMRWCCFVLSSGERSIGATMQEAGQHAKAGQTVRLLDIPVNRAFGARDELHGLSASAFADCRITAMSDGPFCKN